MKGSWTELWLAQLDGAIFLWVVFAIIAALTLIGSLTRRRSRLTDSLRDFVSRQQSSSEDGERSDE